jgi:hypothetical protein
MAYAHSGRKLLAIAVVAAIVLLATGCGSSSKSAQTSTQTSATVDWAGGLCSALTTYTTSLTDAATTLTKNVSKSGVQDAADSIKSATDTFVSDTKGLGKPDTSSGQQAKDTIDTLSTSLNKDMSTIQDATGSGLLQGASTITATLTTVQSQITTAFNQLKGLDAKGELSQAFSDAPSCSSLTSK